MTLKYFAKERKRHPEENEHILSKEDTILLTTNLLYKENIPNIKISFSLNANLGNANPWKYKIKYHKSLKASILLVCHEVAHLIDYRNRPNLVKWHTKNHEKIVNNLIKYCIKNNYFGLTNMRYAF